MSTVVLREHEPRELRLLETDVRFLHQHFKTAIEVQPTARAGWWRVKATSYVGTIVAPGIELRIRPKCGLTNLFAMLTYAHRLARVRRDLVTRTEVDDVREFLVTILVGHLEDLVRSGLRRGYVEQTARLGVLRGRLLLEAQLRQSQGTSGLNCRFEEFTADLPLNQATRHTLRHIGTTDSPSLDQRLRRLRPSFAHVTARPFRPADFDGFVYDRLNQHYEPIHGLCRLILAARGAEDDQGALPMGSFLVDMNALFEKFVANWLQRHLPRPWRLVAQRRTWFDRRSQIQMFPDLVLFHDQEPRLVADTKYKLCKGVPTNPDAYQALAYCRALGLRTAVLLYPDLARPGADLEVSDSRNGIVADGIDLSDPWPSVEKQMSNLSRRLVAIGDNFSGRQLPASEAMDEG